MVGLGEPCSECHLPSSAKWGNLRNACWHCWSGESVCRCSMNFRELHFCSLFDCCLPLDCSAPPDAIYTLSLCSSAVMLLHTVTAVPPSVVSSVAAGLLSLGCFVFFFFSSGFCIRKTAKNGNKKISSLIYLLKTM